VVRKPIDELEKELGIQLRLHEFTRTGFMSAMEKNKGQILLSGDEISSNLESIRGIQGELEPIL
jgi:hypothetical protein